MADAAKELAKLAKQNARLAKLDADRHALGIERDGTAQAAKSAGASWDELIASGMSRATVAKALRRE